MREIKFEILFEVCRKDFTKKLLKHYTSIDRLINGDDDFDYGSVNIIAKRQFTGLQDKNGVDIYEGDVVNRYYHSLIDKNNDIRFCTGVVIFRESYFAIKWETRNSNGVITKWTHPTSDNWVDKCIKGSVVISNIHENPELFGLNHE